MTASSNTMSGNIGVIGVKILTSSRLLQEAAPWTPLLGGSQFDHPVSSGQTKRKEGCVNERQAPPCKLAEEKALNVLNVFFNCTPAGTNPLSAYGNTFTTQCSSPPLNGSSPIYHVNVDYNDILYATKLENGKLENACPKHPFPVPVASTTQSCWSMQDLLSQANFDLFQLAGQTLTKPVFTCTHAFSVGVCAPASLQ